MELIPVSFKIAALVDSKAEAFVRALCQDVTCQIFWILLTFRFQVVLTLIKEVSVFVLFFNLD